MLRTPFAVLIALLSLTVPAGFAQQTASSSLLSSSEPGGYANGVTPVSTGRSGALSGLGIGVQVGLLGAGVQVATPLTSHLNLRAGSNFLNYNNDGSTSGVNYTANLRFRSVETEVDWFPGGRSFHISPGALVYNGNEVTGNARIPAGGSFSINGTNYISDPSDPVSGSGSVHFPKAAPKLTVGWGSLMPRGEHRVSVPFDIGFAYMGDPKTVLNFSGSVCDSAMQGCESIASDPDAQANVAAEQKKLQKDASYARFFPLVSTGFAFRF
ncbi:MAG TPA: hypothetical protein VHX37_03990 [Acidobacteriaceae bacterium]|jgi:hypothetical protein|nr:hypothetical protein [Acidobacteriaceae bacterium]